MTAAGGATPSESKAGLHVVGTSVARETDSVLDRVAAAVGRRPPRVLQVGARSSAAERNVRNWRGLIARRFGSNAVFVGTDLAAGANVDRTMDICGSKRSCAAALGEAPFDLVICCHVLEHTRDPWRAARNIQALLRPGGLAYVSAAWSHAFSASPDDCWRFSVRGLIRLFGELEVATWFYSGGDVGLDVAYRVVRDGEPELDARAGAVEQGLFQVVLDHDDNRAMLARQATDRLPVSRTYLPTLFVDMVGRRSR
ncbi:class I SAM-dependent methyltransferase [Reyranella sp.]|uniref:class I SAM-dependent methyltransferase n=1 Tax=Reyranella sp. TaxID=1929291 RepID=UPI003BAC7212